MLVGLGKRSPPGRPPPMFRPPPVVRGPRRAAATPPNLPDATVLVASEPGERELPGRHASCMAGCLPAASGRRGGGGGRSAAVLRRQQERGRGGAGGSWSSGPADRTCLTRIPRPASPAGDGGRPRRRGARHRQRPCVSTRLPSRSVPPRRGTHGQHHSTERRTWVTANPARRGDEGLSSWAHPAGSPTFQPAASVCD